MKKLIFGFSIALVTLFSVNANAQNATVGDKTVSVKEQDGPKIEFKSETVDYGTIENGADGNREFVFTNTGNAPLIITRAKGSCGCTVPTAPLNKPIAPGESSVIKVHYDTKRTGGFSKSVTLTSNAVNAPTKVIRIKGVVKAKDVAATEAKM